MTIQTNLQPHLDLLRTHRWLCQGRPRPRPWGILGGNYNAIGNAIWLSASKSLDSLQCSICVCFHLPRRCCLDQSGEPDSARPQQSNKLPKGKPNNETVPAVPVISCPRCLTCSSQGKAMHARNSLGAPNKGKLEAWASGPNWATGGALVSKKSGSLANWLGKNDSLYCALCAYMCMYRHTIGYVRKAGPKNFKMLYSYTFFQMFFSLPVQCSKHCQSVQVMHHRLLQVNSAVIY